MWGIGAIPHKMGVADYLEYCKENNISAAAIKAATGWGANLHLLILQLAL